MHNNFLNSNRRYINLRESKVKAVLPEHFTQSYPKFIALLEKYYDWQDQNDPNELLNHLFATRDINETDIALLSFIEDEFLLGEAYFEGFGSTDWEKRAAANFSNQLFRSKGTKFAIEWFFRSFYGLDAEVIYTKENVFTLNTQTSQIGPDSLKYLTNDQLYQTFALLIRVGVPVSKWKDIFKLFVHPAGMYLGGEVVLNDIINEPFFTRADDSAASSRISSSYSLTYLPSTVNEGNTINFTVTGTNIPDNTAGLFYYVDHDTTNDLDFITPPPNIDSMGYVGISDVDGNAVGNFSLSTIIDSDESEGTESFNVILSDTSQRNLHSINVTLNDVISEYQITPNFTTVNEGDDVVLDVIGTNTPTNGSTNLYYYVEHITTDDNDFITAPPTASSPQVFEIRNSIGQISIPTKIDNDLSDDGEEFKVFIKTFDDIIKDSATILLRNVNSTFTMSLTENQIEGTPIQVNLQVSDQDIGAEFEWEISGSAASDSRFPSITGTHIITQKNDIISIPVNNDDDYNNTVIGSVIVRNNNYSPPMIASKSFSLLNRDPVFQINSSILPIKNGDTVSFEITGSNIIDDTYYFYIDDITTDTSDFVGGRPTSGSREAVVITNNNGTTSSITLADDDEIVDENFIAYLYSAPSGGNLLASQQFSVVGSTYSLIPNKINIIEGETVSFNFFGNDGTYYYWIESSDDLDASDFVSGYASVNDRKSFTVSGGTGSFTVQTRQDAVTEGQETFAVKVSKTTTGGSIAVSSDVNIADTSTTPIVSIDNVIGPNDVNEGEPATINVTTSNVPDGTNLAWSISRPEDFDVDTGIVTITGNTGQFTVTPTPDGTTESGEETFTVTVSGTVNGTSVTRTSANIIINDTSITLNNIPQGNFIAQRPDEGFGIAALIRDEQISDGGESVAAGAKMTTRFSRENNGFAIKIELDEANDIKLWYEPINSPNTLTTSPTTIYTNTNVVPDAVRIVYNLEVLPLGFTGPDIDLGWQSTPTNGIEESISMISRARAGAGADDFNGNVYTVKYYGRANGYDDTLLATFKFQVEAYADAASF